MINNGLINPAQVMQHSMPRNDQSIIDGGFMGGTNINLDFFNGTNEITTGAIIPDIVPEKKKRGRPKKTESTVVEEVKTKTTDQGDVIVVVDDNNYSENLSIMQSNEPFSAGFELSTGILKQTVGQLDELGYQVMEEFNKVKNSQMKSKYNVMPLLASTLSSIISTKVTAVREMNKTVKDCYDLEMKRAKETKENQANIPDDQYIMEAYNAFVSAPVGAQPFIAPPSMLDSTLMTGGISRASIGGNDGEYEEYLRNMTPQQNMMHYENNPNIKTVVVCDAENPMHRYFDVIDITTGQSIPNVERPDPMFLEDTTIDERNGIARNPNLDSAYPLIMINGGSKLANL